MRQPKNVTPAEHLRLARGFAEIARAQYKFGNNRLHRIYSKKAKAEIDLANGRGPKASRTDVVCPACGLTHEPDRKHCQICERAILARTGLIAHHGYERPGGGWQTPSCFGARQLPYEEDREAIPNFIAWLNLRLTEKEKECARVSGHPRVAVPNPFPPPLRPRKDGPPYKALIEPGEPRYEDWRESYERQLKQQIKDIRYEIKRLEKRYADWPHRHQSAKEKSGS